MREAARELRERFDQFMLGKANETTLKKEALESNDLGTTRDELRSGNTRVFRQTPAGKHAMRGIPLMPVTGTQPGTNPLAEVIRKESLDPRERDTK